MFKLMRRYLLLAVLLVAASCTSTEVADRPTIPLVQKILSEPQGRAYSLVSGFDQRDSRGSITIVGEESRCSVLAGRFISDDDFDNVDGRLSPDGLPDFSGETIAVIADTANAPYDGYIGGGSTSLLRELSVRLVLTSLDTLCSIGDYDRDFLAYKDPAKLIVLASPQMAAYGHFDLDTLFRSTGSSVKVVSPLRLMFGSVLDAAKGPVSIAVMTDVDSLARGLYQTVFTEMQQERGAPKSHCFAAAADTTGADVLTAFLDRYEASGQSVPLSALLVDDMGVSLDELQESLLTIRSVQSEENLHYRQLITRDFRFVEGVTATARECFRIMRSRNIFTHNIAYPKSKYYVTVPFSGADGIEGEGRFSREAADDFTIMESKKSRAAYVQD